jgi:ATP-dependent RNA helicase HelY
VIVSEERPVPLSTIAIMRTKLIDLFATKGRAWRSPGALHAPNPELVQMARYGGRTISSRQM